VKETHHGDHYKHGVIECIDAMRSMLGKIGFRFYILGTMLKYIWRFGHKDDCKVEAEKLLVYARWLLDNEMDRPLEKP